MTRTAKSSPQKARQRSRSPKARRPAHKSPANGVLAQAVGQSRLGGTLSPGQILAMQQRAGNGAVNRMLAQRALARPVVAQAPNGLLQRADPAEAEAEAKKPDEKLAIPTVIGYIGMNPGAMTEASTLKRVSKDQVLISLDDPKKHNEMDNDERLAQFIYKDLGLHPLYNLFTFVEVYSFMKTVDYWAREQIGQVLKWFSAAEAGKHKLERLVLSGHSDGVDLWGESDDEKDEPGSLMVYRDLAQIARIYPKAAAQVQDIMFSACWSVMAIEKMAEIFPNLQSAWGYIGFSPNIEQGSASHIKKWEMTTRGERTPRKRDRKGKASIWTRDGGYVVGSPADYDLKQLKEEFNAQSDRAARMYDGSENLDGEFLRDIYFTLQLVSIHPESESKDVDEARKMLEITLRLRYWEKITKEFSKAHYEEIKKGYAGFSVAKPSYWGISRPDFKDHLVAFKDGLGKGEHAAAQDLYDNLLKPGLWELDPNIIPDTWI